MNEYLYEITMELEDDYYTEFLRKHRKTISEGEEEYEVICM